MPKGSGAADGGSLAEQGPSARLPIVPLVVLVKGTRSLDAFDTDH